MNFTLSIKQEIINNKMNNQEIKDFISGVICSNIIANEQEVKIKLLNEEIYNKFVDLIKKVNLAYRIESKVIYLNRANIEINEKNVNKFFAGIFLSSGSISNLNSSSYHLEISFKNEQQCEQIMQFAKKHLSFNKIQKRNYYVLYLKKNEMISDFLQIIAAQKSYFAFIDSIIERDFKNQITRIFNLDVHNQNRLVDSNIEFMENLKYIEQHNLKPEFSNDQWIFFEFKRQNEFLSLSQLSEELEKETKIKKTKSGLNHWLIKLRNVVEEHKNKELLKQKASK